MKSSSKPLLSLVLPMYNEEANAAKVTKELLQELSKEDINHELVLVDNGSTDRTGIILTQLSQEHPTVKVVKVMQNQGYGWGIINGLKWANGDYLGFMGGDGQIDPRDVTRVFREAVNNDYHLCKVNRYRREDGALRNVVSYIFNKLFVYTFKVNVGDINGSPKIMTRYCYEQLGLTSKDWFLDAEIMLKAHDLALKIGEVPVVFRRRQGGSSSVRLKTLWEFLRNIAAYHKRGVWNESSDSVWREGDPA
ncbi:glycosyltransferase family 2 protein [Desulforamulus ferrireducens]|uniref:Glycosyl transferase n=1 Tax=Desulforamulus ferrireducens TaxID=1833852 RepID=A0A1S6IWX9_9FIRM|nr:glycosyltransferase family 2 protein [Desulforamulus ferrireducens]AQS59279.1 glycosyl transferase [Desulforamulus ferrireducens]